MLIGGAEAGGGLVLHHGTPGDASLFTDWDALANARGLRLIAISRPGYAGSARRAKRRVADVTDDVDAVLRKLKVPWFVTAGHSGGGPHALACGARLERCRAVATIAGVAPYEMDDLDFLDGMGPENIDEFGAALSSETELREWLDRNAIGLREITGRGLAKALGGLVTQADKDALGTAAFADRMASSMRRGIARSFDGWVDDDLALVNDWGFAPADVTVPTSVWHGDADLMVPTPHGVWLADKISGAKFESRRNHGHISILADFPEAIIEDLLARLSPRA